MKNADQPASPLNGDKWQKQMGFGVGYHEYSGLTKREYFAAMAMQGILSQGKLLMEPAVAEAAVELADAILKQLES